jgi:hypothetical protein
MMDALNSLFWLTGAAVWGVLGTCFVLLLYGEWSYTRAANRFKRKHMTPEEYAMLQGQPVAVPAGTAGSSPAPENVLEGSPVGRSVDAG